MPRLTAEEAVALLGDLGEGRLLDDLAETLSDVLDAVVEHGKKGSILIRVDLDPFDAKPTPVSFTGTVKGNKPVANAFATRYWDGAHLHRHDPSQLTLGDALDPALREGLAGM